MVADGRERTLFRKSVNSQSKFSRESVRCDLGLTELSARGSQFVAWLVDERCARVPLT
jgi:hypothetical protein